MLPDLKTVIIDLDPDIVIRPYILNDVEKVFDTVKRNEEHLDSFMTWMTPEYSIQNALEFVELSIDKAEKKESLNLGIFRGNEFIGSTGYVYFNTDAGKTEIGYWIDKSEEGKGIISSSTESLIDLAFNNFNMNRIEIRCSGENLRSASIPRRLGFTLEATLRQSEIINGRLHDFHVFGMLKNEWRSKG